MVLVNTGEQKDKNGNPVPCTQPTVLAHISGSSQPIALPLSVVTALQAHAKQQQQQQQGASVSQRTQKNIVTSKASDGVGASSQQPGAIKTPVSSQSADTVTATVQSPQLSTPKLMQSQTQVKAVDPKLLQQLLLQQGKAGAGPTVVALPQVKSPTSAATINAQIRPQLLNITKLPGNVVQQVVRVGPPQQVIRVKSTNNEAATPANSVAITSLPNASGTTTLSNLIQAGLMPQGPKMTSFVATVPQVNESVPQKQQQDTGQLNNVETAAKVESAPSPPAGTVQKQEELNPAKSSAPQVVTVTLSPSGVITTPSQAARQAKQISPEILAKLEAQGVPASKQPNIAAMMQANPGWLKTLSSPPKQKYASNVTVKSLLEKRALENLRQKQTETPKAETASNPDGQKTLEETTASPALDSANPAKLLVTPQPVTSLATASPVNVKNASAPDVQVVQGGAIRKVQLTPQKVQQFQPQIIKGQISQVVTEGQQQGGSSSQVQTVTLNPATNVLTIQQNWTPQQIQLLQQQLATKFGAQNVPQNVQILQQVPAQQQQQQSEVTQTKAEVNEAKPVLQAVKQIKVPSGTVTIQPKALAAGTSQLTTGVPKPEVQSGESVINNALKTVMTTVQTSLPTAQIKVSSPFPTTSRNVTITTSAMKAPIPAVPAVEAMATASSRAVSVSALHTSIAATKVSTLPTVVASPTSVSAGGAAGMMKMLSDASRAAARPVTSGPPAVVMQPRLGTATGAAVQNPGTPRNIIVQMTPQGLVQTVQESNSPGTQSRTAPLVLNRPQILLGPAKTQVLQQETNLLSSTANGNQQQTPVQNVLQKTAENASVAASQSESAPQMPLPVAQQIVNATPVCNAAAPSILNNANAGKSQPMKAGGGKMPSSQKTKISSLPYAKPQTIQQLIESKAKASGGTKQSATAPAATGPGKVLQASATAVTLTSAANSTSAAKTVSPTAGTTVTTVMASLGGKMVQLRVSMAPGQTLDQVLRNPRVLQQLQQLQHTVLSPTAGNKPATTTAATVPSQAAVKQQQPQPQVVVQQQPQPQVVVQQQVAQVIASAPSAVMAAQPRLINVAQQQPQPQVVVQQAVRQVVASTPSAVSAQSRPVVTEVRPGGKTIKSQIALNQQPPQQHQPQASQKQPAQVATVPQVVVNRRCQQPSQTGKVPGVEVNEGRSQIILNQHQQQPQTGQLPIVRGQIMLSPRPEQPSQKGQVSGVEANQGRTQIILNQQPQQQLQAQVSPVPRDVTNKMAAAPQVLSAKSSAPRALLATNPVASVGPQVVAAQPNLLTTPPAEGTTVVPAQPTANAVVQMIGGNSNDAQGNLVLVNVGGQIMAVQNVGGKTVLMPQAVNLVGQNTTNVVQNVQAQLVAAPQQLGTAVTLQPLAVQQQPVVPACEEKEQVVTPVNNEYKSEQTLVSTNTNLSPANLSPRSPTVTVASSIGMGGGLMMVGSGLMPVPTTQPATVAEIPQSPPPSRHHMPQQIQMTRQAVAVASSQASAAPNSADTPAAGGLEQLAMAAAQVQEAMQCQKTGPLKSVGNTNLGSNLSLATTVNAQINNGYATLTNGSPFP